MRRLLPLTVIAAAIGAIVGCAAGTSTISPSSATPPVASSASPPIELVGLWRVTGAAGEGQKTWLWINGGEIGLWRDCGVLTGSWTGDAGAFLAQVSGAGEDCAMANEDFTDVPWLDTAVTYTRTASGWHLLDGAGETVASLAVDGAPAPTDPADYFAKPPVLDSARRAALTEPAALPTTLLPAAAVDLVGTWRPPRALHAADPHLIVRADGTWEASDGCNGMDGRWSVPTSGRLLSLGGGMTLLGCDGVPVPEWMAGAVRAGFDGAELVLVDREGTELGRPIRS